MDWDEIQVVPSHIMALTDYLLRVYRDETTSHRRGVQSGRRVA